MTGPEHYRRAEELLGGRRNGSTGARSVEEAIALAQVHATLALTAATAAGRDTVEFDPEHGRIEGVITVADGWAALA